MKPVHTLPSLGLLVATIVAAWPVQAQIAISTNRYDGGRTGANLSESRLTAANVNVTQFGKLYSYPVDGAVYAQPLYVPGVTIGGTTRNVLYVATMHDKVYAFDADSASPSPLWMRDFTSPPLVTPVPITDIVAANKNIVGNVGIQSTPVIDVASRTIYLLARTKEDGSYVQRLHALDIATGASRSGSPVRITGSANGSAPDATPGPNGPVVTFNPKMQSQRAALALSNGVVLIAWAAHEDVPPYHGWIMGYDAVTLAQVAVFCVAPDAYGGGVWQGGRAPTVDAAGDAYFVTGNGRWDGVRNFGNTVLRFAVSRTGLTLLDYFTPSNYEALNAADDDLGGSSFTLLPGTTRLLGGGKEGVLYLLDAANLGRMVPGDAQIPQRIDVGGGHVMGGPVFWNSGTLGPMVYHWGEDDLLRAYRFSNGRLALPPYAQGGVMSPGHPGGSLTVSAHGSTPGTGIVWSSMPASQDGIHGLVAGVLRAFDAETLSEIWNSEQNASRDRTGTLVKFVPPVVVNGRVYMASHDNAVAVYGLLPTAPGPGPAPAGTISIDFIGSNPAGMAPTESAGVVAARNWNAAAGAVRSAPLTLVDAGGAQTSASVTWSAPDGTWQLPVVDQPGNTRMMKGYLDTGSTSSATVSIAGLPGGTYDVYVYADGDNKSYERAAAYTVRGTGMAATTLSLTDAANANFSGTFTPAENSPGNYLRFRISGTGFVVEATPTAPEAGTRRAPINGLQIVPVAAPPPPGGGTISVDFVGTSIVMTPGETAGVVPAANWNSASGAARTDPQLLIDAGGRTTGATIVWSSPAGTWALPVADQPGDVRMMKGYLDTSSSSSTSLTVAGLAQGSYDVYVYADGDNKIYDRGAAYTVSGSGLSAATVHLTDAANANFSGAFTRAEGTPGNYVRFSVTGTGFTVVASPTTPESGTRRAPINGLQIVPTSGAPPPPAAPIGIDFSGNATAMAPGETAGVFAQANWNAAAGAVRSSPLALADAAGAATGASVTWSANGTWATPISDTPGNLRLMRGYLDTSSTSVTTVTVSGLRSGAYDVYVYADGDNREYTRSAIYRLTAPGGAGVDVTLTDPANTNFQGAFAEAQGGAGNYVRFTIAADGFTVAAMPSTGSNTTRRAPINAIQIVPK
jgi:hypothetical protein